MSSQLLRIQNQKVGHSRLVFASLIYDLYPLASRKRPATSSFFATVCFITLTQRWYFKACTIIHSKVA